MITAHFFDGMCACGRPVVLEFNENDFAIVATTGPYSALKSILKESSRAKLRFDGRFEIVLDSSSYIVLDGPRVGEWLSLNGLLRGSKSTKSRRWSPRSLGTLLFIALLLIGSLLLSIPTLASAIVPVIPLEIEEQVGEHLHRSIIKNFGGECSSTEAIFLVQNFVESLLKNSNVPRKIKVTLVKNAKLNAFAAPGGYIYVLRGIVSAASTGDEFAAIVAHELGHVTERHTLKSISQQVALKGVASYLGSGLEGIADASLLISTHLIGFAYSRNNERDADMLGVKYLHSSGVTSKGATSFFRRIRDRQGDPNSGIPGYLATHPSHTERIEALLPIEREGKSAFSPAEWDVIKGECG